MKSNTGDERAIKSVLQSVVDEQPLATNESTYIAGTAVAVLA